MSASSGSASHDADAARAVLDRVLLVARALRAATGTSLVAHAYRTLLRLDLEALGHRVAEDVPVEASWAGRPVDLGCRADLMVDGLVVVQVKASGALGEAEEAELRALLLLTRLPTGIVLDFAAESFEAGLLRADGLPLPQP